LAKRPKKAEEQKVRNEFYLETSLHNALTDMALSRHVTKTQIVEEALREYFQRRIEELQKAIQK